MKQFVILLTFLIMFELNADDIDSVIDKLLTNHPEILSLNSELNSKRANANHETTYPDPKVGVAFRNYPTRSYSLNDRAKDTPGMTGIEYTISQEIPYPGKLTLQGKVSKLNEVEFSYLLKSKKNQFLLEYLSQLVRLKSSKRKIHLNKLIRKTLESQKNISSSTFATGNSALSKTLKLQIEETYSQEREIELSRDSNNSQVALEYFEKESTESFKRNDIELKKYLDEKYNFLKIKKEILKSKIIENPNYQLATVSVERAKQESKLSNIMHAPDTEIYFGYTKRRNQTFAVDDGPLNYQIMDNTEYRGDLFSFGMNVRVPVWSFFSSQDLKEKSSENTKSKSYELERNKLFLESSFDRLYITLESIESKIELYQKKLIPELTKSSSALSSQFTSGKTDLIEVLGAKLELEKAYISEEDLEEKKAITTLLLLELTDNLIKNKEI